MPAEPLCRRLAARSVVYTDAHLVGVRFRRGAAEPGVEVALPTDLPARAPSISGRSRVALIARDIVGLLCPRGHGGPRRV
jgi:hypothetical protein